MNEKMEKNIRLGHLGRVEGHGGIEVDIQDGKITRVNFDIYEGSRFYEALIVGKHYREVPSIVSRVCAICSVAHTLTSQMAIENAFSVAVSPQTTLLRGLLLHGGMIESHALHVFLLVLPDFLQYSGALDMAKDYPTEVGIALRLKKLGNAIQTLVGGRAIHPINPIVGGFGRIPTRREIEDLHAQLEEGLKEALKTVPLFENIELPDFADSPSIFAALRSTDDNKRYRLLGDRIITSLGDDIPVSDFREICHERVVRHSHAKQSLYSDKPFMVGALARVNLNHEHLAGEARNTLNRLMPELPLNNTVANTWAQLVELVHSIERSIEIIDTLLSNGLTDEEPVRFEVRAGAGTGASEAPRGMLFHYYVFDENGCMADADIVTPTAQNLANIEKDFHVTVERCIDEPRDAIAQKLELVARAYDPCISCAVHLVRVNFS